MNRIAQFPFVSLPTELILLILTFAARPDFALIGGSSIQRRNPYSSALAACRVSRDVRRAVLPIMLETVFLRKDHQLIAFLRALHMQKGYSQHGHHLCFEYTAHICKIWVGSICEPRGESACTGYCIATETEIDFSILAPVLLAAPSLAIDGDSLYLLDGCIQVALRRPFGTTIWQGHRQSSWMTNILTLSGFIDPFRVLGCITDGSAFFSSISRLIFVPPMITNDAKDDGCLGVPLWMMSFLQSSFTGLRSISMPLPYVKFPDIEELDIDEMRVPLITLPAPPLSSKSVHQLSMLARNAHTNKEEALINMDTCSGEGVVWRVRYHSERGGYTLLVNWEEAWAHGMGYGLVIEN